MTVEELEKLTAGTVLVRKPWWTARRRAYTTLDNIVLLEKVLGNADYPRDAVDVEVITLRGEAAELIVVQGDNLMLPTEEEKALLRCQAVRYLEVLNGAGLIGSGYKAQDLLADVSDNVMPGESLEIFNPQ